MEFAFLFCSKRMALGWHRSNGWLTDDKMWRGEKVIFCRRWQKHFPLETELRKTEWFWSWSRLLEELFLLATKVSNYRSEEYQRMWWNRKNRGLTLRHCGVLFKGGVEDFVFNSNLTCGEHILENWTMKLIRFDIKSCLDLGKEICRMGRQLDTKPCGARWITIVCAADATIVTLNAIPNHCMDMS